MIPLDPATLDQIDSHAPFVVFIIFVLLLGAVMVVETIREARAKRRRRAAQALEQQRRSDGIQAGIDAGWHDAPGDRRWIR